MCARACVYVGTKVRGRVHALALLIQYATRMRHTVTSFAAPRPPRNFCNYIINCATFGEKLLNKKCAFSFSLQRKLNFFDRFWGGGGS